MTREQGAATDDPFDLQRFVDAQEGIYDDVLGELSAGRKRSHWMWFIFPQMAGLGHSAMAQRYAISGRDEARAYLRHTMLGARLVECSNLVVAVPGRSIREILGTPDDMKFLSSMTLFEAVSQDRIFGSAIERFYGGHRDARTLALLNGSS